MYHALLYRLIFAVIRQGRETSQRLLFEEVKLNSFIVDNFIPFFDATGNIAKPLEPSCPTYAEDLKKIAARGFLMNCANAINLQVNSCSSPGSFLAGFMNSHQQWQDFLPILSSATDLQLNYGMGIKVTSSGNLNHGTETTRNSLNMVISEALQAEEFDITDKHSRFAKSLGFFDYTQTDNSNPPSDLYSPRDSLSVVDFEDSTDKPNAGDFGENNIKDTIQDMEYPKNEVEDDESSSSSDEDDSKFKDVIDMMERTTSRDGGGLRL